MRLFTTHNSGICYAPETVRDTAAPQHVRDFAIRIGDYGNGVVMANSLQSITGSWEDLIPVGRLLRILDQSISQAIVQGAEVLQSEEHTSELQSPDHLVCRLLLEKKKWRHTL